MTAFTEAIRWNYLYVLSTLGFVLVLVFSLTGHPALAAMIGVSVITWWTWIPGMTSKYVQEVSMSDFFSVVIALQVGVFASAVMGFFSVLFMMVFGKLERPTWVIRGAVVIFIVNLLIPYMYKFAGNNMLLTLYYYTIVFYIFMSIFAILMSPAEFFEDLRMMMMAFPVAFLTNTLYVTLFGDLVEGFVQDGLKLNVNTLAVMGIILMIVTMYKVGGWYIRRTTEKEKKEEEREAKEEMIRKEEAARSPAVSPKVYTPPVVPTPIQPAPPVQPTRLPVQPVQTPAPRPTVQKPKPAEGLHSAPQQYMHEDYEKLRREREHARTKRDRFRKSPE